ncbi:MAG: DedA family protein [Bdellovibrionales bacterium]|nr:DedA family protein [Bdellovibrionales bacterium]
MQEWFLDQTGLVVYAAIFFGLVGGAVGLPIPEDVPLVVAGIAISQGKVDSFLIFLVCYVSIVLADLFIYFIGRRFGPSLFKKEWFKRRIPPKKINRIRKNLERRSLLMILIARHLFYLRTVTFLTCGAVRVKVKQFIIADMLAALVSVPAMMSVGYLAAEHYEQVMKSLHAVELVILVIILAIAGSYYLKRRKRKIDAEPVNESEVEL